MANQFCGMAKKVMIFNNFSNYSPHFMKKEFTEEEIYSIDQQFRDRIKEQEAESRRKFFLLLIITLGLLMTGAVIGLILSK